MMDERNLERQRMLERGDIRYINPINVREN